MQRKANAIQYPDWSNPTGIVITRAEGKNSRPLWKKYERGLLWLRRVAQLDIIGGPFIYDPSKGKDESDAELLEKDRRAAWRNARRLAEMLWRDNPHMEYAVYFRPEGKGSLHEAVCVCRVIPTR